MNLDPASILNAIEADIGKLDELGRLLWAAMREASEAEADWQLNYSTELLRVVEEARDAGERTSEDIRHAKARRAVQAKDADLWARYVAKPLEVERLKKLVQIKSTQISARQTQVSALKAEARA